LEEARLSARRLVKLLESPRIGESCRGGLAPWQKRKIDHYIRENLAHPLERDRLAAQISLSTCHFSRAFKESFGESPHVYIIGLRLELAKELMLSTDESLSQIAFACGFADQSHFTKVFRRGLGETPHMWRRLNVTETKQLNRRLSSDLVTAVVTGGMTLVIEAVGQQSTWKQAARITAPRCATIMDTCHRAATDSPLLARGSGRG
jgi:AraC-like DNA-binding protein